ncbi:hypothetical protein AB0M46_41135 [Dactylosporangium sp. NPDC051485]|uniref:hypothetical protein n=1 Tax=Dactylosporangium sp. NPDC051485 TaxID=3154846 RepID=UPI00343F5E3E
MEEFVAVGAMIRGLGFAQVAKAIGNLNNPDVATFEKLVVSQLGVPEHGIGSGFSVDYWQPPRPGVTWWRTASLDWTAAKQDAEAWMQVRHLLTHGLTSGWRAEHWPGPLRQAARPASSVLRETLTGRHTLVIHGAITCARIYVETSRHLAALTAQHFGRVVDVDVLPVFPLYKEQAYEQTPPPAPSGMDDVAEELPEEGEDAPAPEAPAAVL